MRPRLLHLCGAILGVVAVSGVAGAVYGGGAFLECVKILGPLAAVTTLLAEWIAANRVRLGGVRGQAVAIAIVLALQVAIAAWLFAQQMFLSQEDAMLMALVVASSAGIGVFTIRLIGRRSLEDLGAVRRALDEVAAGSRDIEIPVHGDDELGTLAADVRVMVERLAAEEDARRTLIASVSHDLRTPVTTLQLIAEGLEDGIFEPERTREQLALISTHVRALGSLINDLFELSRLETGDVQWSMSRIGLDDLVRETVDALRPGAEANGVFVRAELAPGLARTYGNPEQIQRVLFNLVQNAVRHTPRDGSVVVRAKTTGDGVEIEVADDGEGIAPANRERIFEPFVQASTPETRANGNAGLGLAISRAIVEAHGGRIWVADAERGTRVRFSIPHATR
jgi:signal transduction histidine kinase